MNRSRQPEGQPAAAQPSVGWHRRWVQLACLLSLSTVLVAPGQVWAQGSIQALQFSPGWDARWQYSEQQHCQLSQELPDYGVARFVASPTQGIAFELQAKRDLFAPAGGVEVHSEAADWRSQQVAMQSLGKALQIPGGGAIADGQLAGQMFWALQEGKQLVLQGWNRMNPVAVVQVAVTPLGFAAQLSSFMQCAATQVSVSWQELSRTRIDFDSGGAQLNGLHKLKLDAIVSYVSSDTGVSKLFVDGHADGSGERRSNLQLSQRRAQAVVDYLVAKGVDRKKLVLRFHGARYPIADNNNPRGRAKNRRATVRLEKDLPV